MVVGEASILCIKGKEEGKDTRDCDVIKIIQEIAVWVMERFRGSSKHFVRKKKKVESINSGETNKVEI